MPPASTASPVLDGTPSESTSIARQTPGAIASVAPSAVPATASITQLLTLAVEKGTPVEQLKELVALHEHIETREARRAFAAALAAFQAECRPIFRAKKAEFATRGGGEMKYNYASLDDIVKAIAPILAAHELSYRWNTRAEKGQLTVDTIVTHIAGHSETTSFTLPVDTNAAMSEQQKYGAALTFGQRRGLSSALGLVTTDEDPDSPKLDPTPITEDQATVINDLLVESRVTPSRFLKHIGAASVEQIKAVDYDAAVAMLTDLKAKREGK